MNAMIDCLAKDGTITNPYALIWTEVYVSFCMGMAQNKGLSAPPSIKK